MQVYQWLFPGSTKPEMRKQLILFRSESATIKKATAPASVLFTTETDIELQQSLQQQTVDNRNALHYDTAFFSSYFRCLLNMNKT